MSIKNTLKEIIIKSIELYNQDITTNDIIIKHNHEGNYYLTNIALIIANRTNKTPYEIANIIKNKMDNNIIIDRIIITDKNILHIYLKQSYLTKYINTITNEKRNYGKNKLGINKQINITFSNHNINSNMNLETGRKAIYCDNLSRIMNFCGYNITKNCIIDNEKEIEKSIINSLIDSLKKELDTTRIYIDNYENIETIANDSIIEEFLLKVKYTKYCYINDDSLYLKTTSFGDNNDRLLIKKDGSYTDIVYYLAYNYYKIKNDYNLLIYITNNEKKANILLSTIPILEEKNSLLEIINYNEINFKNNNYYYLSDVINEIGINSTRYYFCLYNIDIKMDFDPNIALNKSKENPFYYIEHANILLSSILRKSRKKMTSVDKYNNLKEAIAYNIINKLALFEDVVMEACKKRNPSLIAYYTYELVDLFYKLDDKKSTIPEKEKYTNEELNLLNAIQIVLNNSLNLIGIIPREEM